MFEATVEALRVEALDGKIVLSQKRDRKSLEARIFVSVDQLELFIKHLIIEADEARRQIRDAKQVPV